MSKEPSAAQLAARQKFAEAARKRAAEAKKRAETLPPAKEVEEQNTDISQLQKQIDEIMETNALLKAALLNKDQGKTVGVGRNNQLLGEIDKYLVDPNNYPDPTPRLKSEPRLQTIAFNHNYELEYEQGISSYETKTGVNMREPKFYVTLNKIVIDDQGNQTPKRYIARKMIFHEDPQAALVIARDNNLDVDKSDERVFLNEMRYLRVRDWLFDIFWPKSASPAQKVREEAIGGTIVQVFEKSSVEPSNVEFDKLNTKV